MEIVQTPSPGIKMIFFFDNFVWICQFFSPFYQKKTQGRGSPEDFRRDIVAGPHGIGTSLEKSGAMILVHALNKFGQLRNL